MTLKNSRKRFYTRKSYKLMNIVRNIALVLAGFIWVPLYVLMMIGEGSYRLLDLLDDGLQYVLDRTIPQIK